MKIHDKVAAPNLNKFVKLIYEVVWCSLDEWRLLHNFIGQFFSFSKPSLRIAQRALGITSLNAISKSYVGGVKPIFSKILGLVSNSILPVSIMAFLAVSASFVLKVHSRKQAVGVL